MAAWYVWSALGFYPSVPGAPMMVVGTPLFPRVEIDLGGRKPFASTPLALSARTPYIASASVRGRPLTSSFVLGRALRPGGRLVLQTSTTPTSWASAPGDVPPSVSTADLSAFGC